MPKLRHNKKYNNNKQQPKEKTMTKKYNNIQDVSTTHLYKMLSLKNFQDKDNQKMIKDEIKFRDEPVTQQQMVNILKMGIVQNCK